MSFKKNLKLTLSGVIVTSFSIIPATYTSAVEEDTATQGIPVEKTEITEDDFKEIEEIKVFTNQQLFDELEKQGYELTDIFTEEEIEYYKAQDKLRAGQTQWVENKDGTATLYLSSAYTKTIKALGSAAAGAIGGLIGGGVASGALAAMLTSIVSDAVDGSKGIYITFSLDPNYIFYPSGWGYQ